MRRVWPWSLVIFASLASLVTAQDEQNFVTRALDIAQPRMVKVYGASAGRVEGYATGIIVSADGQVLTTQGVFLDGNQVRVVTPDGKSHSASILKRDRTHQLALLQISAQTPDYFEVPTEEKGAKGDWVVAICNAFKVADKQEPLSATLGVISLRTSIEARLNDRDVAYAGDLILIDQITSNPGAAGGAVVNTSGELVGVIGKIINSSETNTRLNYAIPNTILSNFLNATVETVKETTADDRQPVYLGIRVFAHGGRNSPAYVDNVKRGSPAHKARLKPDDLLVSIAGETIGTVNDYNAALKTLTPGAETIIVVKRGIEFKRLVIIPEAR